VNIDSSTAKPWYYKVQMIKKVRFARNLHLDTIIFNTIMDVANLGLKIQAIRKVE